MRVYCVFSLSGKYALTLTIVLCVLQPGGKGKRLPEVHCIISRLGCFNLFSKVRGISETRYEFPVWSSLNPFRLMLKCNCLKCLGVDLGGGGEEERDFSCFGSFFHAQCHGSSLPRSWAHHHCQELPARLWQWGKVLFNSAKNCKSHRILYTFSLI